MKKIAAKLALLALPILLALPVPILLGAVVVTGCSTSQVDPGQDQFIVEAEKDLRTAFYVVDGFLAWEHANRASVGRDVTALADDLRIQFPLYLQSAQDTLRAYKRSRTTEGRASAETWIATINAAMIAAIRHMPQAEAEAATRRQ